MTRFDGWETQLYGDVMALPTKDELMHFRTKGSKNGVRRYQTESGEWTPLGLKERKAREGWGQSRKERRAEKRVEKAERRAVKAEKRTAKIQARQQRMAAYKAKRNKNDLSGLSDEELQKKIARVKMEQEYKELTRSPLLKSGEKLVSSILNAREKAAERENEKAKRELESNRLKADVIKAREATKQHASDATKAKYDMKKMVEDRKAGKKTERKKELLQAKIGWRKGTIRGGVQQKIHDTLTAKGEGKAERIKEKAFVKSIISGRKRVDKYNNKLDPWQQKLNHDPNPWDRKKNKSGNGGGKNKP